MANSLDNYSPEVWFTGMVDYLQKEPMLAKYAWKEPSSALASYGDTVNIQVPGSLSANQKVEGSDVTIQNISDTNVAVVMDQHYEASYQISARDEVRTYADLVEKKIGPAAEALVRNIETAGVTELAKYVRQTYGTPGTTPSSMADVAGVQGVLTRALVPKRPRVLLADNLAHTSFLGQAEFTRVDATGSASARETGVLGDLLGTRIEDWLYAPSVAVPNTGATFAIDLGAGYAAGVKTIHVDGLSTSTTDAVKAGEIISINHNASGTSYQYVVQADADTDSNGDADLSIEPGLELTCTDGDVITRVTTANKTSRKSFAMHPQAIAYASRPMASLRVPTSDRIYTGDFNGIVLTICIGWDRDSLSTQVTVHCLYGWKIVRKDFAAILFG